MASWQAHLAVALFRWRIKRALERTQDIAVARKVFGGSPYRTPSDVRIEKDAPGGVEAEWVQRLPASGPILIYFHGGGYFGCSPRTHRAITVAYARQGFRVCVPKYRLAPENRFPAAVEDALAVYGHLVSAHPDDPIVISGDSAGGGLATALLIAAKDAGLPLPAAAALFSPWVDLAATGSSLQENDHLCAMFRGHTIGPVARTYLDDTDPRHPLASPLYADLRGLPPLLIHAAQNEVLRDDSIRLAERAQQAGVPVELKIWPVVPHCWQLVFFMPEARHSLQRAGSFLRHHASRKVTPHV